MKLTGSVATLDLYDSKKNGLAQVRGTPGDPKQLKNPPAGSPIHYPAYVVMTVNGTTDVIEHRQMEPVFHLTDNPLVLDELGVSANNWRGP